MAAHRMAAKKTSWARLDGKKEALKKMAEEEKEKNAKLILEVKGGMKKVCTCRY